MTATLPVSSGEAGGSQGATTLQRRGATADAKRDCRLARPLSFSSGPDWRGWRCTPSIRPVLTRAEWNLTGADAGMERAEHRQPGTACCLTRVPQTTRRNAGMKRSPSI